MTFRSMAMRLLVAATVVAATVSSGGGPASATETTESVGEYANRLAGRLEASPDPMAAFEALDLEDQRLVVLALTPAGPAELVAAGCDPTMTDCTQDTPGAPAFGSSETGSLTSQESDQRTETSSAFSISCASHTVGGGEVVQRGTFGKRLFRYEAYFVICYEIPYAVSPPYINSYGVYTPVSETAFWQPSTEFGRLDLGNGTQQFHSESNFIFNFQLGLSIFTTTVSCTAHWDFDLGPRHGWKKYTAC